MIVELRNIHKSFGSLRANDGITLTFAGGRVYGLLGENGAGKTTLMKILSGLLTPDTGEIVLDGRPLHAATPAAALRYGIGMVHQDPMDFVPLKVLDNFIIGRSDGLIPDRRRARRELAELSADFDFHFDPDAPISHLTVGERQQLEIVRLLASGVQVLILDEPTTGISGPQKAQLFNTLRRLAQQGKTIIFVSHKLDDVQDVCSEVVILRKGKVVGQAQAPFTTTWLVERMFGQVLTAAARQDAELGRPTFQAENLYLADRRFRLGPLSLTVAAGEVIGIAGIEGSGQQLFLQTCAGLFPPAAGRLRIGDADMTGRPYRRFRAAGVAYVPASRLEDGLVAGLTLTEHVLLTQTRPSFFLSWAQAREQTAARIKEYNIIGRPETPVDALSGGNQQRTLLALLPDNLRLLLLEHPTRGLDVESTRWIWTLLLQRRRQGTAIMFASSDLDELLEHSDRILVFCGGKVTQALPAKEISVQHLAELIGGKGL